MSRSKWRLIFRDARGFVIFGTPPLASRRRWARRSCPIRRWDSPSRRASTAARRPPIVASFFRPGFADVPPFFLEDVAAHRRAGAQRSRRPASRPAAIATRSRSCAISRSRSRCCMAREEQLVNGALFRVARHADAVAGRGADDPRRRTHAAMGDARGLRRADRGVHRRDGVRRASHILAELRPRRSFAFVDFEWEKS